MKQSSAWDLVNHDVATHKQEEKPMKKVKGPELECLDCSFTFKSARELVDHTRDVHQTDISTKTGNKKMIELDLKQRKSKIASE